MTERGQSASEIKAAVQNSVVDFIQLAKDDINLTVALQLKAFRAETRWWITFGVIANQTLAHVHVPQLIGYAAFVAFGAKAVAVAFSR